MICMCFHYICCKIRKTLVFTNLEMLLSPVHPADMAHLLNAWHWGYSDGAVLFKECGVLVSQNLQKEIVLIQCSDCSDKWEPEGDAWRGQRQLLEERPKPRG